VAFTHGPMSKVPETALIVVRLTGGIGVKTAIETSDISIPPYAVFKIVPHRVYVSRFQNGIPNSK
jgi:hypothetical protein